MKFSTVPLSLLSALPLFLAGVARADDYVLREHRFDLSEVRQLEIDGSVGEIDIKPVEGSELTVILEIEGKDEGWFRPRKDVSKVDLESRRDGDRLRLRMDERDTETHWRIALPAVPELDIDFGVGAVRVAVRDSAVDVHLGVGEVTIVAPRAVAGDIDLDVGVGETRIQGAREQQVERAFVSQNALGRGEGQRPIRADVGVGEVRVTLE